MHNKIKELLKTLQKKTTDGDLLTISQLLKDIKKLLIMILLKDELLDIGDIMSSDKPGPEVEPEEKTKDPAEYRQQTLESLEDIATVKRDEEGNKMYLLHRPTENFEYSENVENIDYESSENSEWYAEYMSGEINQDGQNPVLSCWIPEANIIGSEKPHANTGTWGELGKNPFSESFKVIVKPGKFQIYQELKQRQ